MSEFIIPNLGDGVAQGDVLKILVKVGDSLAVDQPVLELETQRGTIGRASDGGGRVCEVKVKAGDKGRAGRGVGPGDGGSGSADGAKAEAPAPAAAAPAKEQPKPEAAAAGAGASALA